MMAGKTAAPEHTSYDVIIIGGAIMGASTAWFLSDNKDFDGRVLVIERDMTLESCSTARTNSCMRQQFSTELNVRISQFAADCVKNIRSYMGDDIRVQFGDDVARASDIGVRSAIRTLPSMHVVSRDPHGFVHDYRRYRLSGGLNEAQMRLENHGPVLSGLKPIAGLQPQLSNRSDRTLSSAQGEICLLYTSDAADDSSVG